ncbi:MAG TPA: hypothetical protein DDZ39_07965 [Flavobacteriaceae bacterium]|nr:hypothetical protein [Flavobacteriaceae bacterium]HBS12764.1 hypothetical protein [Flavobacteriaceae bacterium]
MKNLRRFFEYGYLIIGLFLLIEGVNKFNKDGERNNAYLALGLSALAIFMFFFKKHFRKKIEARNNQKKKDTIN